MASPNERKTYRIPSKDWGITASEAGSILISAEEIKKNKPLLKAALADLKAEKKARDEVLSKKGG